mmetsp:Transcript_128468/g.256629  ORF Transcript_128468/g.256629 Transcript_128468/m.256629 type:complete len:212 (-) Transcript_128468:168-803(-)
MKLLSFCIASGVSKELCSSVPWRRAKRRRSASSSASKRSSTSKSTDDCCSCDSPSRIELRLVTLLDEAAECTVEGHATLLSALGGLGAWQIKLVPSFLVWGLSAKAPGCGAGWFDAGIAAPKREQLKPAEPVAAGRGFSGAGSLEMPPSSPGLDKTRRRCGDLSPLLPMLLDLPTPASVPCWPPLPPRPCLRARSCCSTMTSLCFRNCWCR